MLQRHVRARLTQGVVGDTLNRLSFLTAVSACLAVIVLAGSHVGTKMGFFSINPLLALRTPHVQQVVLHAGEATHIAGLAPDNAVAATTGPPPTPSPDDLVTPVVPNLRDLNRPITNGTWIPIV